MEKEGGKEKPVTRLHDMVVQEVSLVDRAANKRRFLLTKRGEGMATEQGAELKPDGEGGLTEVGKGAAPNADGDAAPVSKVASAKPLLDKLTALADKAKALKPDDEAALWDLAEKLEEVSEGLEHLAHGTAKAKGEEPDEDDEKKRKAGKPFPGAAPPFGSPGNPPPTKKGEEPDDVEKAGKKMSAKRLGKLKEIHMALGDLIKDVDIKETAAEPTAGPSIAKADAEVPEAVAKALQASEATVTELRQQVAKQREQIEKLAKAQPAPTSIPVEERERTLKGTDVSWPLDMNDPVDREHVAKDVSFHDAG